MNEYGSGLARRLGIVDAVVIGLGSMLGAGVFSAFAPAAAAAGAGLMLGLAVAALVAYANATSSAQLAATYPTSGGTYAYGRERLGPWWGFVAGWSFVVGKTASCAAMALTFAAYAVPAAWQRPAAVTAVAVLTAVNHRGITRTAGLARVLLAVVLGSLAVVVAVSLAGAPVAPPVPAPVPPTVYGVLQSAGLLFFAFAGYARVATLGEEVRDPGRTIPRAITLALAATVAVYLLVGATLLRVLGPTHLASSAAPLADAARAASSSRVVPVAAAGAAAASLGALLALLAGVTRTALAMARHDDLPRGLAAVHPDHRVPHRAVLALGGAVTVAVLVLDVRGAIGFSSTGVLLYYAITNLSAVGQPAAERRYPRWLQVLGGVGCAALVVTLPWRSVVAGGVVLAVGIAGRAWRVRRVRG